MHGETAPLNPDGNGDRPDYLNSREACALLDVKRQTFYAYVSRGWIRSIATETPTQKLYLREDIESIKKRSVARRGHTAVAAAAMHWGPPILESSITEITPDGPRYRGVLATSLVRDGYDFEQTAMLLWTGILDRTPHQWRPSAAELDAADRLIKSNPVATTRDLIHLLSRIVLLPQIGRPDPQAPEALIGAAQKIVYLLAWSLRCLDDRTSPNDVGDSIAQTAVASLGVPVSPEAVQAVEAELILSADHELSQCTFVARVAASAEAELESCVSAAILSRSGRMARRVEEYGQFVALVAAAADPRRLIEELQHAKQFPPGYNSPLYVGADPRSVYLSEIIRKIPPHSLATERICRFFEVSATEFHLYPQMEIIRMALCAVLGLKRPSAMGLFFLARSAGWVAHIIEQAAQHDRLRPRAYYIPENTAPVRR